MEEEAAKLTQQVEKQQQKVQILQEEVKDSLSIPELGNSNGQKGFCRDYQKLYWQGPT
jgi:hypothetical protein